MNFKNFKTKLISRVMLLVLLLASAVNLVGCGFFEYEWEVDSHEKFAQKIEEYNSRHDLYVDTFISFDLDDNNEVTKRLYSAFSIISTKSKSFSKNHGYICDIHDEVLAIRFLYYLKSTDENVNDYAYKIKCNCRKVDFNFTENDDIEIVPSKCKIYSNYDSPSNDLMYEASLITESNDKEKYTVYNHAYHYSLNVNGVEVCCIHISSIEEATEEKLAEIIQMMQDSLVVLNTEKFFIWRDNK